MLRQLIHFELKLHTRQVGFWISCLVLFLLGVLIMSVDFITVSITTGEKVKANGANTIAGQVGFFSLLPIFFGAIFVVTGIMRDQTHKMLEVIHGTPISTFDMTFSRMVGVITATFLCVAAGALGLFAGQFAPWIDKETLAPFTFATPLYFLYPTLIFAAINSLFVAAIFTLVAGLTRNRALVYVSAVGLFMVYMAVGIFVGEDAPDMITSLTDPFGMSALAIETEFWPAAEQNTRMASLTGLFGLNRLLWFIVSLGLITLVFPLFKRGIVFRKTKRKAEDFTPATGKIIINPAPIHTGFNANAKAFVMRIGYEFFTTVKSVPFIILMGLAFVLFGITVYSQMQFIPDPALPTSLSTAQTVIGSFGLSMIIIIVFFSGEIIWRDRMAGVTEIIDATPVQNWPLLAAKWLAMVLVIIALLLSAIIFGIATQLFLGDVAVNLGTYFKFTFLNVFPNFLGIALLALFIQNFMPNRVLGMLVAAGLIIFFRGFIGQLPFYHPLMGFGLSSPGGLSEINGYNSYVRFKWFNLYWGSLCGLFVIGSIWLWRRGLQTGLMARLKSIRARMTPLSSAAALILSLIFIGSGATIFKAYNIDNEYRTQKQAEKRSVAYEKFFKDDIKAPVPKITDVSADIFFYPSKQQALAKGRYKMTNKSRSIITDLYVRPASAHDEDIRLLTVSGAKRVTAETAPDGYDIKQIEDYDYRLFRFDPPLAPGDTASMEFETFFHEPKLADGSAMRKNGTFMNNFQLMPSIEIQDARLRNPDKRRKYKLDELEKAPERTDQAARQFNFISRSSDYVNFDARVCTDPGQIPIAPGQMIRAYEEAGRDCREYKATRPILNFFSFLTAKYDVTRDVWSDPEGVHRDVPLAIYFHGPHNYNVDLMIDAMKTSLDSFTKTFGPYPYHQIRIMEFPYGGFAQAFAGTIPFSENIGFVRDPGDPDDNETIDLASYVTMHEIGHQWFAHQIVPAENKGFNILSEGLTENAAMTAYEHKFGWQKARRLLDQRSIQSYLTSRGIDRDDEPKLSEAENQRYLIYNKASWVFWGLKHYIGVETMQGAIRAFLKDYGYKGPPYPTTKEMIDYLREAAGPDYQQLITDYWDRITLWELSFAKGAEPVITADGEHFKVSFTLKTDKRIASEENGKEQSVSEIEGESLSEWVEIGFYDKDSKETLGDEWIALERVKATQAETELSFTLDKRPTHILLDPRRLLIERNVKDNSFVSKTKTAAKPEAQADNKKG